MKITRDVFDRLCALATEACRAHSANHTSPHSKAAAEATAGEPEKNYELEIRYRKSSALAQPGQQLESGPDRSAFVVLLTYLRSLPSTYQALPTAHTLELVTAIHGGGAGHAKRRVIYSADSLAQVLQKAARGEPPARVENKAQVAAPVDVPDFCLRCAASEEVLTTPATTPTTNTATTPTTPTASTTGALQLFEAGPQTPTTTPITARYKQRFSFRVQEPGQEVRMDLTVVRTVRGVAKDLGDLAPRVLRAPEAFEIEMELPGFASAPSPATECEAKAKAAVLLLLRHWSVVLKVTEDTEYVIPASEKAQVMSEYSALVNVNSRPGAPVVAAGPKLVTLERDHVATGLAGYAVTEKADGEHRLVFVSSQRRVYTLDDRLNVRFTGRTLPQPDAAQKAAAGSAPQHQQDLAMTLVEGEMLPRRPGAPVATILLFDAFFVGGDSVAQLPLMSTVAGAAAGVGGAAKTPAAPAAAAKTPAAEIQSRLAAAEAVAVALSAPGSLDVRVKAFYPIRTSDPADLAVAVRSVFDRERVGAYDYPTDGLIFTPAALAVGASEAGGKAKLFGTWKKAYKWKPPEFNTIDFLVRMRPSERVTSEDGSLAKVADLYVAAALPYLRPITSLMYLSNHIPVNFSGARRKLVPQLFQPADAPTAHVAVLPATSPEDKCFALEGDEIMDDSIVEFRFNAAAKQWQPLRVRHDKTEKYARTGDVGGAANKLETALSVWRSIQSPVTAETLTSMISASPTDVGVLQQQQEQDGEQEDDEEQEEEEQQAASGTYYARRSTLAKAMRLFHNRWVKGKHLLMSLRGRASSLVDFGCGRAGDLNKWAEMSLTRVLGLDLYASNLQDQADGAHVRALAFLRGTRPSQGVPRMAFLPLDLRRPLDVEAIDDQNGDREAARVLFGIVKPAERDLRSFHGFARMPFDVVSCQFAVHYFFESAETLAGFTHNLVRFLRPGGYLVGTCLDGARVREALRDVPYGGSIEGRAAVAGAKTASTIWRVTRLYHDEDSGAGGVGGGRKVAKGDAADLTTDTTTDTKAENGTGQTIRVYMESIGQALTEYLVPFDLLVKALRAADVHPLSDGEAKEIFGWPSSTGFFEDLHQDLQQRVSLEGSPESRDRSLQAAAHMSDDEKRYSYLNRWFAFKRAG